MIRKRLCILLLILVVVFSIFSIDKYSEITSNMYSKEVSAESSYGQTQKITSNDPSVISLTASELAYHLSMMRILISQCGADIIRKIKMIDNSKSYVRVLFKIDAIAVLPDKTHEIIYYVYFFTNRNSLTQELIPQSLDMACLWEDGRIILNSGFKEDVDYNDVLNPSRTSRDLLENALKDYKESSFSHKSIKWALDGYPDLSIKKTR